jgi:hypothetical protein
MQSSALFKSLCYYDELRISLLRGRVPVQEDEKIGILIAAIS